MAEYKHLNIYKTSYDLMIAIMHKTKHYSKEYKYSIGEQLQKELIEMILCIYRANNAKLKVNHIESILEKIQTVEIFIRMSVDLCLISKNDYANYIEQTSSIAKQAQGWLQASKFRAEPVEGSNGNPKLF